MDRRRFFPNRSLTESVLTESQKRNLFEDTMAELNKLYEDENQPEQTAQAASAAQPTPADPAAEPAKSSGDDFNPAYKDINEIKNKVNALSDEETKQIEDPTINLTGEPDKLYDSLINVLNNSKLASAVDILNIVAADDKLSKLLKHGFNAASGENKQVKVTVKPDTVLATNSLVPTQNVVVISNSLDNLIQGFFVTKGENDEKVQNTIDYAKYFSGPAPVPQPFVYQAGNVNYIIDGHHRWSQAYCMNPNGTVKCVVVEGPSMNADAVLKNFQAAIAVNNPSLPKGSGSGDNLFGQSVDSLKSYIEKKGMPSEVADKIATAANGSEAMKAVKPETKNLFAGTDNQKAAGALLATNGASLGALTPGANNREIMPQAKTAEVTALIKGALPVAESLKRQYRRRTAARR